MKIFKNKTNLSSYINDKKKLIKRIGFVPTMGALHKGHLSLIEKAKNNSDIVVVSIFVNPTQFDKVEDLEKYPRTIENDLELLKEVGCDVVYTPETFDLYEGGLAVEDFDFDGLEFEMEGQFREGHFNGVGTVVKKLFNIVNPDKAFFGKKDFQQLQIIKKLVEKEDLEVEIIGCPVYREEDGLAMSSRNARLSNEHRLMAPFIYRTLKKAKKKFKYKSAKKVVKWVKKKFKKNELLNLEYFKIADESTLKSMDKKAKGVKYRAFVAVYAGDIRLIDTIKF